MSHDRRFLHHAQPKSKPGTSRLDIRAIAARDHPQGPARL